MRPDETTSLSVRHPLAKRSPARDLIAQSSDDGRQQCMLGGVNSRSKRFEGVGRLYAHGALVEDRAPIHIRRDAVNGAAGDLYAASPRLANAVEPREARQQARMEVDDFPGKRVQKPRLQHPHEAGQHHKGGLRGVDRRDETCLALAFEFRLERRRIDEGRRHSEAGSKCQNAGDGLIGKNSDDARTAEPPGALRFENRLGIGAAAGSENDDTHACLDFPGRLDSGDQIRRAETGEEREKSDLRANFLERRPFTRVELIQGIVTRLAVDVRPDLPDFRRQSRLVKYHDGVDARERALERPDTHVGIQRHDERIAQQAGLLQKIQVPRVQEVEDAIGQDDALSRRAKLFAHAPGLSGQNQFWVVEIHGIASLAIHPAVVNPLIPVSLMPPQMNMRPVLIAALVSVLAASAFASAAKPVIGLSLDTLKEERWQHDRDTFTAAAEKLGATVVVQSANSDDTRQVRDVESLISRGVDVLVIVPHNGAAMTRAVRSANEAKIPVISYDRLILNCAIDYYLTFDNVKVGEAQANYAVAHLPKDRPAKIVRIYGAPTDNNAKMFKKVTAPAKSSSCTRIGRSIGSPRTARKS